MNEELKKAAVQFSMGRFEPAFPYLSQHTVWEIVGEKTLQGAAAIIDHCNATAAWFATVDTSFEKTLELTDGTKLAIAGHALFCRNGEQLSAVQACDIYFFEEGKILKIESYCIVKK
jgi:hypothetical protein